MKNIIENKKGEIVLRNIMVMIILFAGFLALASMFVKYLADDNAYDNLVMLSEYNELGISGLGNELIDTNLKPSIEGTMLNQTGGIESGGVISSFLTAGTVIRGTGAILIEVVKAPSYIGGALTSVLSSSGWVSTEVATLIKTVINLIIYVTIFFVILSALSPGGGRL